MKLRVCHFSQVPYKPFITEVEDLQQAKLLFDTLANYDLFQYENNIKLDYANMTVLEMWDEDENEWMTWFDELTGIDDLDEYFEQLNEKCLRSDNNMNNKTIMDAYNEMSKAKFEADDAINRLEQAKKAYYDAKMNECIKDILKVQEDEGKLTKRDLEIFLSDLVVNVVSYSR